MTKIDELREELLQRVAFVLEFGTETMCDTEVFAWAKRYVDSLVSAAHEEGEERMRLKFMAKALGNENDKYVSVPAVLLAPVPKTKEEYEKMCRDVGLVPEQPEKDDETR